jgi:hypothetical protein
MTWFDRSRRAASVLIVVPCVLTLPAVANATFGDSRAAVLTTGTDRLETPTGITGNYQCTRSGRTETVSVTVTTFTVTGRAASSYRYYLGHDGTITASANSTSKAHTLTGSIEKDGPSTTWTIGVQSNLQSWTSDVATVSIVCPAKSSTDGSF